MEKIKYEWLYIIFVHEDDIIFKGTHLRSHLKNQIDSLSECTFNDKIKVIIIQNTRKIYRALSSTENKLLGIKGGRAFLYETRTYDSFNLNEKVELKEIHKTNYWQNAFDFTFKEFEAKNYVLHTVSHCTGHQINCTNDGFAQNIFGNHLKKYENKFSNNNIGFFKKTFRKIVSKRENKFFLISGQPKFNSKKIKLFALQKKHIKQWPKYNFTNGLLFFDFIRYLKSTNIKFEYVFLNNCHAMLYENVFLLNGLANFVFGTTGLIKDTFVNAGIVYNNLLTKNRKAEDIVMTIFNEFRKKLPEMNEIRHYTIIRAKDNVILHNTFAKIIGEIVKKFQQSNEYKIALINFIDSRRENGLNIISDEPRG